MLEMNAQRGLCDRVAHRRRVCRTTNPKRYYNARDKKCTQHIGQTQGVSAFNTRRSYTAGRPRIILFAVLPLIANTVWHEHRTRNSGGTLWGGGA